MYPNLLAEMARAGVRQKDLLPMIGRTSEAGLTRKMNRRGGFTLDEAFKIKSGVAPGVPLEILFKWED